MDDHESEGSATAGWFKSTRSTATCTCVEVRFLTATVQVRDSKQLSALTGENVSDIITLPTTDWRRFVLQLADHAAPPAEHLLRYSPDDSTVVLHCTSTGVELTYDLEEWQAFQDGALDGEFDPPDQPVS